MKFVFLFIRKLFGSRLQVEDEEYEPGQTIACEITQPQLDDYELGIIDWCNDFAEKLLEKYRKGKAEHGDLSAGVKLDIAKEIAAEVSDILIYHMIGHVQNKTNKEDRNG